MIVYLVAILNWSGYALQIEEMPSMSVCQQIVASLETMRSNDGRYNIFKCVEVDAPSEDQ